MGEMLLLRRAFFDYFHVSGRRTPKESPSKRRRRTPRQPATKPSRKSKDVTRQRSNTKELKNLTEEFCGRNSYLITTFSWSGRTRKHRANEVSYILARFDNFLYGAQNLPLS